MEMILFSRIAKFTVPAFCDPTRQVINGKTRLLVTMQESITPEHHTETCTIIITLLNRGLIYSNGNWTRYDARIG